MVGESSRHGEVSRELAVLEPPPGDGDGPSSANEMTSDKPDAAGSVLVPRRCLKLGEKDWVKTFFGRTPPQAVK
jgi:hypothetical protein